jgi:hypothetical protein
VCTTKPHGIVQTQISALGGGIYGALFAVAVAFRPAAGCLMGAVWVRLQGAPKPAKDAYDLGVGRVIRLRCSRSWAR